MTNELTEATAEPNKITADAVTEFLWDTLCLWLIKAGIDGLRIGIAVAGWVAWQRTHDVPTTIFAGLCSWGYVAYIHWWTP